MLIELEIEPRWGESFYNVVERAKKATLAHMNQFETDNPRHWDKVEAHFTHKNRSYIVTPSTDVDDFVQKATGMQRTIHIEAGIGEMFSNVAKKAKEIVTRRNTDAAFEQELTLPLNDTNRIAEFDFNGITCYVSQETNLDDLHRDYTHAHSLKWEKVGPICAVQYSQETLDKIEQKRLEYEEEMRVYREESDRKQAAAKIEFEAKTTGLELDLSDPEGWAKSREVNPDGYGKATLDFAENWAKLMQAEIAKGKTVAEVANDTSHKADIEGITGNMYYMALSLLTQVWVHGEELKEWKTGGEK